MAGRTTSQQQDNAEQRHGRDAGAPGQEGSEGAVWSRRKKVSCCQTPESQELES
jgi:hypothetical protein